MLVTMGFHNGAMVDGLRYWYEINPRWIPAKGLPFSVSRIVLLAAHNLYFFRDDNIAARTLLCFSKTEIMRKGTKDKKLKQYVLWAWNECIKYKWFLHVTDDRYTFGENTNIEFISKG